MADTSCGHRCPHARGPAATHDDRRFRRRCRSPLRSLASRAPGLQHARRDRRDARLGHRHQRPDLLARASAAGGAARRAVAVAIAGCRCCAPPTPRGSPATSSATTRRRCARSTSRAPATSPTRCPSARAFASTSSASAAASPSSCASSRRRCRRSASSAAGGARSTSRSLKNGIVLVTGPTGSGKSSTLAAIIDLINETRADHILTIEDPIEFLHQHKKATVHQRELHSDTPTFALALRAALRQAPKVILVGEMRDRETIEIALTAAETGHLVLLDAAHDRRLEDGRAHRRRVRRRRSARDPRPPRGVVPLLRVAAPASRRRTAAASPCSRS